MSDPPGGRRRSRGVSIAESGAGSDGAALKHVRDVRDSFGAGRGVSAKQQHFAWWCIQVGLRIAVDHEKAFQDFAARSFDIVGVERSVDTIIDALRLWKGSRGRLRYAIFMLRRKVVVCQRVVRRYLSTRRVRILVCTSLWERAEQQARQGMAWSDYCTTWIDNSTKLATLSDLHCERMRGFLGRWRAWRRGPFKDDLGQEPRFRFAVDLQMGDLIVSARGLQRRRSEARARQSIQEMALLKGESTEKPAQSGRRGSSAGRRRPGAPPWREEESASARRGSRCSPEGRESTGPSPDRTPPWGQPRERRVSIQPPGQPAQSVRIPHVRRESALASSGISSSSREASPGRQQSTGLAPVAARGPSGPRGRTSSCGETAPEGREGSPVQDIRRRRLWSVCPATEQELRRIGAHEEHRRAQQQPQQQPGARRSPAQAASPAVAPGGFCDDSEPCSPASPASPASTEPSSPRVPAAPVPVISTDVTSVAAAVPIPVGDTPAHGARDAPSAQGSPTSAASCPTPPAAAGWALPPPLLELSGEAVTAAAAVAAVALSTCTIAEIARKSVLTVGDRALYHRLSQATAARAAARHGTTTSPLPVGCRLDDAGDSGVAAAFPFRRRMPPASKQSPKESARSRAAAADAAKRARRFRIALQARAASPPNLQWPGLPGLENPSDGLRVGALEPRRPASAGPLTAAEARMLPCGRTAWCGVPRPASAGPALPRRGGGFAAGPTPRPGSPGRPPRTPCGASSPQSDLPDDSTELGGLGLLPVDPLRQRKRVRRAHHPARHKRTWQMKRELEQAAARTKGIDLSKLRMKITQSIACGRAYPASAHRPGRSAGVSPPQSPSAAAKQPQDSRGAKTAGFRGQRRGRAAPAKGDSELQQSAEDRVMQGVDGWEHSESPAPVAPAPAQHHRRTVRLPN